MYHGILNKKVIDVLFWSVPQHLDHKNSIEVRDLALPYTKGMVLKQLADHWAFGEYYTHVVFWLFKFAAVIDSLIPALLFTEHVCYYYNINKTATWPVN